MGETPLHSVVRSGNAAVVGLLLRNTVDSTIPRTDGERHFLIHRRRRDLITFHNELLTDSGRNKSL